MTATSTALLFLSLLLGADGEVSYNGIRQQSPWPPPVPTGVDPIPVPYLASPPEVIPIEVGRQLFVDDFLIEKTDLARTYHHATYHPATPVLVPDKPWEITPPNPTAGVYSDGVWYDPQEKLFKMWYRAGETRATAYATSRDGIRWEKPILDVVKGTNIVLEVHPDSATLWRDTNDPDASRRYKLFRSHKTHLTLSTSPDGIHFTPAGRSGPCGDRTTVFYNPFRKVWVFGLRARRPEFLLGRSREYWEHPDAMEGLKWKEGEPAAWVGSDRLDPIRPELKYRCELYNLDAVAYESLLLGLFSIWRGQHRYRPKPNEICLGFSRDGFHWHRPDRTPFMPVSERHGDWNWGNVQSAGGGCLIVGDKLYFYCSARAGVKGTTASGVTSTGLATLRRDGFASMDAGAAGGTLTTRPIRFTGKHLFVNLDALDGELRAEVLDAQGDPIKPFTRENCIPAKGDKTLLNVTWRGAEDLANLSGKSVRISFHLKNGRLYSFWVSSEKSGASHGYVAAGGPGYTSPIDTMGSVTNEERPQ